MIHQVTLRRMLSIQSKVIWYRITYKIQYGSDSNFFTYPQFILPVCTQLFGRDFPKPHDPDVLETPAFPQARVFPFVADYFSLCWGNVTYTSIKSYASKHAQMDSHPKNNVRNNSFFQTTNFNCCLNLV